MQYSPAESPFRWFPNGFTLQEGVNQVDSSNKYEEDNSSY